MSRAVFLPILAAFTLWALGFLALYGLQATGCRLGWPDAQGRLVLGATLAALLAAIAGIAWWLRRAPAGLGRTVGLYATLAAGVSTLFCFSGVFWLTLC